MVPKIVCMKIWQLFAGGPEIRYSEKIKRGEKHLQVEKKQKQKQKQTNKKQSGRRSYSKENKKKNPEKPMGKLPVS